MYLAIENCLKLSVQGVEFLHDDHWMKKKIGPIHNLEELEDLVNSQMSQLRTTEIPPLLVEVSPNYVGMTKVGDYAVINGNLKARAIVLAYTRKGHSSSFDAERNWIFGICGFSGASGSK